MVGNTVKDLCFWDYRKCDSWPSRVFSGLSDDSNSSNWPFLFLVNANACWLWVFAAWYGGFLSGLTYLALLKAEGSSVSDKLGFLWVFMF